MQPIFNAILQNDVQAFLVLVDERESSLDERSEEEDLNNTVLHMAAKLGHRELVSKIIELRPYLVFSRNAYGNTPLHLAVLLGDVNIVMQMLESGLEVCSARNNNNQTPLYLACHSMSMEAAKLVAKYSQSADFDELNYAISCGFTCVARILLERFPWLAKEEVWIVEGGSLSTLLHRACHREDIELTRILLGLDQRLEEALNTNGLSPLHLAVLKGSILILKEFLDKAPNSFNSLTPLKETVFHLAARKKNIDAFAFMAESLGFNSQILLQLADDFDNTVLHIAASLARSAPLIRYIVGTKIVDINSKNKMGFTAFQLLPQEAEDFELLSSLLRPDNNEEHNDQTNIYDKPYLQQNDEILRLQKKSKSKKVERGNKSLEYEMHVEALQNARNTIAIVAVLIGSVSYAGGLNPPGSVYEDGPWRGKSMVGKSTAFKVFSICNTIALFTSLCIVILLVSIIPYKRKPLKSLLVATHRMMWVSVGFMATAYVAASWVTIPHYDGTRWLFPAIISIGGGALTILFSYLAVETISHWVKKMNHGGDTDIPSINNCSDMAVSGVWGYFTY